MKVVVYVNKCVLILDQHIKDTFMMLTCHVSWVHIIFRFDSIILNSVASDIYLYVQIWCITRGGVASISTCRCYFLCMLMT